MRLVELRNWAFFPLGIIALGMAIAHGQTHLVGSAIASYATGVFFRGMAAIVGHLEALRHGAGQAICEAGPASLSSPAPIAGTAGNLADLQANLVRARPIGLRPATGSIEINCARGTRHSLRRTKCIPIFGRAVWLGPTKPIPSQGAGLATGVEIRAVRQPFPLAPAHLPP